MIGTYGSNDSASEKKIITSIIAVFILIFWIKALLDVVSFYARNNLGFSIEYDLKDFIFNDHWFLTSLSLGATTFLIFVLYNQISMYRRKKLLLIETDEERQLREAKETQIRQQTGTGKTSNLSITTSREAKVANC